MTFKDVSSILGTWVSIAAAIVGGVFALDAWQQSNAKRVDERVAYSFRMAEDYHRSDIVRIRSLLTQAEAGRRNPLQNAEFACSENPAEYLGLTDPELATLVGYFERARMCVEAGLCSEPHLRQLIGPYATNVQSALAYHISQQRRVVDNYGDGIASFSTSATPSREEVERACADARGALPRHMMLRVGP